MESHPDAEKLVSIVIRNLRNKEVEGVYSARDTICRELSPESVRRPICTRYGRAAGVGLALEKMSLTTKEAGKLDGRGLSRKGT